MTQSEIKRASKKADTGLCKIQDLFSGYNITDRIANRLERACDAIREVISEIEATEPKRNSTT